MDASTSSRLERIDGTVRESIIADNLSKAGWGWGCLSAVDSNGQTIWIVDVHRDEGKRFVAHSDEKLSAFLQLERVTRKSCDAILAPLSVNVRGYQWRLRMQPLVSLARNMRPSNPAA
jgi:hypothetical protein